MKFLRLSQILLFAANFLQKRICNGLFLGFSTDFLKVAICLVIFSGLVSCGGKEDNNALFNEKYAEDIEKIKEERTFPKLDKKQSKIKLNFTAPIEHDSARYTNENTSEFPEYYSTQQFANQQIGPSGFRFPGEMFETDYSAPINSPFRKIGAEFDTIAVPSQDAYGIKAAMTEKDYLLVSRKLLQKNIDNINYQKTEYDIRNSQILIAEQRSLKRKQKMLKIFGKESLTIADESKSEKAEKFGDLEDDKNSKKSKLANKIKAKKVDPAAEITSPSDSAENVPPVALGILTTTTN